MYQKDHSNHSDTNVVVTQKGFYHKGNGPGYKSVKNDMGIMDPVLQQMDRLGEPSRSVTAKFSGIQ